MIHENQGLDFTRAILKTAIFVVSRVHLKGRFLKIRGLVPCYLILSDIIVKFSETFNGQCFRETNIFLWMHLKYIYISRISMIDLEIGINLAPSVFHDYF